MDSWPSYFLRIAVVPVLLFCCAYGGYRLLSSPLPLVGVIQWTWEVKALGDSVQGVIEGLREEGYQDGLNIHLEAIDVRERKEAAASAARDFQKRDARLLVTVGTVATLMALDVTRESTIPIVYVNVASPDATSLSRPAPPAPLRFTGASMGVPAAEQLGFLLQARPGIKRLGILFCTSAPAAVATGEAAAAVSPKMGLTPVMGRVLDDHPDSLEKAVKDLLGQHIDALFIPADPVLVQEKNLKIICAAALQAAIPVMTPTGTSVAYGPLMSYHCDFVEMGRQAGRQAARLLQGASLKEVPPETPNIKRLTINLKTAQELNLRLPRQLLSQAYKFYQ
jgi:putative tryptophan/tyrosine transport system substrate-binding protein